jgi:NhaP-type Na+/H+ or K+/H+ antiporter
MQSRKTTLIESIVDIGVGFIISLIIQEIVFYCFSIKSTFIDKIKINIIFCIIGLARTYLIRRLFRRLDQ